MKFDINLADFMSRSHAIISVHHLKCVNSDKLQLDGSTELGTDDVKKEKLFFSSFIFIFFFYINISLKINP